MASQFRISELKVDLQQAQAKGPVAGRLLVSTWRRYLSQRVVELCDSTSINATLEELGAELKAATALLDDFEEQLGVHAHHA